MKNRLLLSGIVLSAIGVGSAAASNKPNVIFIFADDMGYGDVRCNNPESKIETPFFDKIVNQGLNFTDAHSNSSVSTPSRYGIITGRYCWRSSLKKGVLHGYSPALIESDRPTVASMLRDNGYQTACIGKWHLGMDGWQSTDGKKFDRYGENIDFEGSVLKGPTSVGFDYYYGISASLDMAPYLFIENDKVVETPTMYYKKGVTRRNPYGRDGHAIKDRQPSHFLSALTDKVVDKIGEYSKGDKPFFIYFPMNAPHSPIAPHPDFAGKSKAGSHGDFVMEIDYRISQVYAALEANGVADNTLVVISSDNGPEVGAYKRYLETNHCSSGGLKGVKRDLWEGGHRVPMFVTWGDKIKKGRSVDTTVCLLDFYSTVADIVGHKLAGGESPDGFSYLPLIEGKRATEREYTIHHSASGRFAIRKGDWVLIETKSGHDNGGKEFAPTYYAKLGYQPEAECNGQLFNLKGDLREMSDQYAAHPEIVAELTALLNDCRNLKQ